MISGYKESVKLYAAEEIFDIYFYRPLAFLLVKALYPFPVTPNQVSVLSMAAGLLAAWNFSKGTAGGMLSGGIWYMFSNILDCADGQLARMKKNGTMFGRIIDGVADYVSGTAVFIGIGFGLSGAGGVHWMIVVLTGISTAYHAIIFDHYQSGFISAARGERSFSDREIARFGEEIGRSKHEAHGKMRIFLFRAYLNYLKFQKVFGASSGVYGEEIPGEERVLTMRFWSFLGPTTNRTLLIICALFNRIDLYLWIVLIAGNLWGATARLVHRRIVRKLNAA